MYTCLILTLLSLPAATDTALDDARLNDVCFVDAQHGWAVGDRGVIWHTDDGGDHWQRQTSGISSPLHAVAFHDQQLGWAAGGFTQPYTHASTGLLLTTRDGGRTWTHNPKLVLPALRRIAFFDAQRGWAAGRPSTMYPSGLFVTSDGGRSWRPLPGGDGTGVRAADMLDLRTGAVAGPNGKPAIVHSGEIEILRDAPADLRRIAHLQLIPPALGWLVGNAGLIKTTTDLGSTWQTPPALPSPSLRYFDFHAIAVRGPKCWIAGSPGTKIFHTPDFGRTWQAFDTGTPIPLLALSFADDQHGWAGGELGTILATNDGGRSWRHQRAGGNRASLHCIVTDPDDVPLELIARFSGNEGHFSMVDVLARRDLEVAPRDNVPPSDRLQEAVARLGGSATGEAWQFPLRQVGLRIGSAALIDAWDRVHDGHGLEELHAHIVRQIRIWRPDVLVTDDAHPDDAASVLIQQAVLQAVAQAADEAAFPAQIVEVGLKPWRVSRVYAAMPPGARGTLEINASQLLPGLGCAVADAVAEPRGLLQHAYNPSPPTLAFRLLAANSGQQGPDRRDAFDGLSATPGSDARRQPPSPLVERLDSIQRIAKKRRNVQAILERAGRGAWSAEQLLAQLDGLTRDLDRQASGQILYQLADRLYHIGQWSTAAETFQQLIDRYPDHSLAPLASVWLVQYYASAEAAYRNHSDTNQEQQRWQRAAAIAKELERSQFEIFSQPDVRFPFAAALRSLGQPRAADRLYQMQPRTERGDAWWSSAQAELHLVNPKGRPTKSQLACPQAAAKPHLDGLLDDPLWQQAKPATLQSDQRDDADWPASAMLAYDAEFLYLAIRCRKPTTSDLPPAEPTVDIRNTPRPRNADLSGHDRVEFFLDIDRDYATYYRLAVDRRGWTNEDCWGDSSWNPTWFVAVHREPGTWTVEAAIPLKELANRAPKPHEAWAIGIQRVVPGVGFQSWSKPAAVAVAPDGFGHLVFD